MKSVELNFPTNSIKKHTLTHTKKKYFNCEICGAKSCQKVHLETCMSTHTGNRIFHCEICGAKFSQKGNLKRHILTNTHWKKTFSL